MSKQAAQKPAPRTRKATPKKSPIAEPEKAVDPAMAHWLDFFGRYHATHALRPVALSLLPEPVPVTDTQSSRYVYEVGARIEADGERFMLIAWEIDMPGIRMVDCASLAEAMERFERRNIYGPGVATVRLRPENRPW